VLRVEAWGYLTAGPSLRRAPAQTAVPRVRPAHRGGVAHRRPMKRPRCTGGVVLGVLRAPQPCAAEAAVVPVGQRPCGQTRRSTACAGAERTSSRPLPIAT
jgi:hypothetical protein